MAILGYMYQHEHLLTSERLLVKMIRPEMFGDKKLGDLFTVLQGGRLTAERAKANGVKISTAVDCHSVLMDMEGFDFGVVEEWVEEYRTELTKKMAIEGKSVSEIQTRLDSLGVDIVKDNSDKIIKEYENYEAEISKQRQGNLLGMSTGLKKLDDATGGIMKGNIWIVGGYTGVGKSYLAQNIALNIMKQPKKRVLMVSLEMPNPETIARLVGMASGFGRFPMLKGEDMCKYTDAKAEILLAIQDRRLILYDNLRTVNDVMAMVESTHRDTLIDVLMIDYIQNFMGDGSFYERMSDAALKLQALAIQQKIATIVVSQISNEGQKDEDYKVMSYKGAGEIANIADVGIRVMRYKADASDKVKYNDEYDIMIQKSRNTGTGTLHCRIDFPSGVIKDI